MSRGRSWDSASGSSSGGVGGRGGGGDSFGSGGGGGGAILCPRTGDRLWRWTASDMQTPCGLQFSILSLRLSQTPCESGWRGAGRVSCVHFTNEQTEAGTASERLSRGPSPGSHPALCQRNKGLVLPKSPRGRLALPGPVSASPRRPLGPTEVRLFLLTACVSRQGCSCEGSGPGSEPMRSARL